MDTLISLIHDLLWLWVVGFLLSGGYFLWGMLNPPRPASPLSNNLNRPAGARSNTNPRKPSDIKTDRVGASTPKTPKPASFGDKPTELMTASDLTIKPAEAKKSDDTFAESDDSTEGLFSGLGKKPDGSDPSASGVIRHKIARMEEIGFHHQIESDKVVPQVPAAAVVAESKAADTPTPAAAVPRSQTAELDDILRRIDKVLADGSTPTPTDGAAIIAPAPAAAVSPVPAATEKPTTPAWARPDVLDEDLEAKPTAATAGDKPASSDKVVGNDKSAPSDEQQKLF